MVTVTFIKSPTGKPWSLAYNTGDQGLVSPQKAEALLEAGMIKPINLVDEVADASTFKSAERIVSAINTSNDLSTKEGVRSKFGEDVEAMKTYCDDNKIKYSKAAKRPEFYWSKIAKHNSK